MKVRLVCLLAAAAAFGVAEEKSQIARAIADPLDNICIPQIAFGGGWKTTITLMNMDGRESKFRLLFADSSGRDTSVRINTPSGIQSASAVSGTLPANGSGTIELPDSGILTQAWGFLIHNGIGGVEGTIAGHAIFQQQVAGKPAFEAVAPINPFFERRVRLPFDNANGYSTGMAVVNTDTVQATFTGQVYSEAGEALGSGSFTLPMLGQRTFVLSEMFPAAKDRRGMIELTSSGRSACSLGLRFHPSGAFTSTTPLSLPTW